MKVFENPRGLLLQGSIQPIYCREMYLKVGCKQTQNDLNGEY